MDRARLHRLGRRLVELSRDVHLEAADVRPSPAEELIISDVMFHPGSTVGDVVARTGFAQSYVSRCVANMVARDVLVTTVDQSDRRRVIIAASPALQRASRRRTVPLTVIFAEKLGDDEAATRVLDALEGLADQLLGPEEGLSEWSSS